MAVKEEIFREERQKDKRQKGIQTQNQREFRFSNKKKAGNPVSVFTMENLLDFIKA